MEKVDLEDEETVNKLNSEYESKKMAQKKNKPRVDDESSADSEIEKEIKRLSKLHVLLNRAGEKSQRKRSPKEKGRVLNYSWWVG